jgi:glycolate oxidase
MKKDSLKPYETDASQIIGKTTNVFLPKDIKELQKIVQQVRSLNIRGGGTGLAGGSVPQGESTIDISKIDKIIDFNKDKKTIIVESGIILDDLQDFLTPYNLEFPINPSSHSICTIGGMISANAVGSRAIKYGKTSDWVLWIDTINSNGKIERKNKTELMDFAGMEGITGIIIRACLKLTEKKNKTPEFLKFENLNSLIEKVKELKKEPQITMIEFLDRQVSVMIGLDNNYHLFIEHEGSNTKENDQSKELYHTRDKVYPRLSEKGFNRIEDPKLMLEKSEQLINWLEERQIPTYGHISVGILHPCFSKKQEKLIPEMIKLVKKLNGQITGEHGIGILKKEFIDPNDKKLIINMKKRLDPLNKFNPGKVL